MKMSDVVAIGGGSGIGIAFSGSGVVMVDRKTGFRWNILST